MSKSNPRLWGGGVSGDCEECLLYLFPEDYSIFSIDVRMVLLALALSTLSPTPYGQSHLLQGLELEMGVVAQCELQFEVHEIFGYEVDGGWVEVLGCVLLTFTLSGLSVVMVVWHSFFGVTVGLCGCWSSQAFDGEVVDRIGGVLGWLGGGSVWMDGGGWHAHLTVS
ncbi:hypothetical protein Tco_0468031 [Tanacetum coccineum]